MIKIKELQNYIIKKLTNFKLKKIIFFFKNINYSENLKKIYKYYFVIFVFILLSLFYIIGNKYYDYYTESEKYKSLITFSENSSFNIKNMKNSYKTTKKEEEVFKKRWKIDLMDSLQFKITKVEVLSKKKVSNKKKDYLIKLRYISKSKKGQINLILILLKFKNKIVYLDSSKILFISNNQGKIID